MRGQVRTDQGVSKTFITVRDDNPTAKVKQTPWPVTDLPLAVSKPIKHSGYIRH